MCFFFLNQHNSFDTDTIHDGCNNKQQLFLYKINVQFFIINDTRVPLYTNNNAKSEWR